MSDFKIKKDYHPSIKKVFDTLTITGQYQVIGSASLEAIKYNSDYDLQEFINDKSGDNILTKIYKHFKKKFKYCKENKNYFITDFKCGINKDGEPLRWDYDAMMLGVNNNITFQQALLMKSTIKMDMIVLINKIFTEFSENYYFKFGQDTNYYKDDQDKNNLSIEKSFDQYLYEQNFWKALKRLFSLLLQDKKKNKTKLLKLIDFFNSNVGLINKCKIEFDIILLIMEQKFRKAGLKDIYYNITIINEWANNAGLNVDYLPLLSKKKFSSLEKSIKIIRDDLANIVNKYSFEFLQKHFKNFAKNEINQFVESGDLKNLINEIKKSDKPKKIDTSKVNKNIEQIEILELINLINNFKKSKLENKIFINKILSPPKQFTKPREIIIPVKKFNKPKQIKRNIKPNLTRKYNENINNLDDFFLNFGIDYIEPTKRLTVSKENIDWLDI
jgi:hypothetical protein